MSECTHTHTYHIHTKCLNIRYLPGMYYFQWKIRKVFNLNFLLFKMYLILFFLSFFFFNTKNI